MHTTATFLQIDCFYKRQLCQDHVLNSSLPITDVCKTVPACRIATLPCWALSTDARHILSALSSMSPLLEESRRVENDLCEDGSILCNSCLKPKVKSSMLSLFTHSLCLQSHRPRNCLKSFIRSRHVCVLAKR